MNEKDYILACISEEAGEIVQAVGKSHRFGLLDTNPGTERSNYVNLHNEVCDLVAVYEMLCNSMGYPYELSKGLIEAKKVKVAKYMEVSVQLGRLDD